MALSQIQCLDDNHVNPRTNESKPEFFYCEDQRLALEALLHGGREAFAKFLEVRGLRGFLSDPELETLSAAAEPFDPGSELLPVGEEDEQTPLSLQYWPELSDTSVPQMDLGWPNSDSYRGVTRASVYTQPPLDGQAHIKEVVRKMIAQAQKVIAVVMDVFTDVDIFRDLLDAAFKRKVSVYILLERTTLPHFLSMCRRASMHAGHVKHLRVRCNGGVEFHTRHCTKFRGRMGHRFMFIDGDKAVSGSYSFTWMSSRLDRNLVAVITGQAVEAFDQLFRFLYVTSSAVDLRKVTTEPEPEPDPRPQVAAVAPPSAAVARKMYNPKYALVALSNPSPISSVGNNSSKEPEASENSTNKKKQRRRSGELEHGAPPLHPGLIDLEKANLIPYLPTWPEPDPPSDVIGFINIRDASKPTQVHLQRSEMFETSQAIKFSSPLNKPPENLPEVATPRQLTDKLEKTNKLHQERNDSAVKELVSETADVGQNKAKNKAPEQKSPPCSQKSVTTVVETENKPSSNTTTNPDSSHETPNLSPDALLPSSNKVPSSNQGRPSDKAKRASTSIPQSDSVTESNSEKEAQTLNTESTVVDKTHTLKPSSALTSQLHNPTHPQKEDTQEKMVVSLADSHTKPDNTQPKVSCEVTHNLQTPSGHGDISSSSVPSMQSEASTLFSQNNPIAVTTVHSSTASSPCTSLPSPSSPTSCPLPVSALTTQPSLTSSASAFLTSFPPVPKPRTVKLVLKDSKVSDSQTMPEIGSAGRPETSKEVRMVDSAPALAAMVQTTPMKKLETDTELHPNSKTGDKEDTENPVYTIGAPQQKQCQTSQEKKNKVDDEQRHSRADVEPITGTNLDMPSDLLINDSPKTAGLNIQEITTKDVDSKPLMSTDPKTHSDCVIPAQTETSMPEKALTNLTQSQTYLARSHEPQMISFSRFTSQDVDVLECPIHSTALSLNVSKDDDGDTVHASAANTLSQLGKRAQLALEPCTDSVLNDVKYNTNVTFQEQLHKTQTSSNTPEKPRYLKLSLAQAKDSNSPTTKRESQSPLSTGKIPTPDWFPPSPPTPDSRTTSPNPRAHTPDFRTPTSDISDGYLSPKEDSFSNTSEEYYECCDSPLHEDHIGLTYSNASSATITDASPAHLNYSPAAAASDTTDQYSGNEADISSRTTEVLLSSLHGANKQRTEPEDMNEIKEGGEIWLKRSNSEKMDQESQETRKMDTQEVPKMMKPLQHKDDSTETAAEDEVWVPMSKRTLIKSAADQVADGVSAGALIHQETEPKQWSTGDLKLEKISSQGERPERASLRREKVQSHSSGKPNDKDTLETQPTGESRVQKLFNSPSKPQRLPLQDNRPSSSSRPERSPRPLSGSQFLGAYRTESKVFYSGFRVSEKAPSARRSPSRPPVPVTSDPVGPAVGRKQFSQERQPVATQVRSKPDQPQSQTPRPQHYHHTHSNLQLQVSPSAPVQPVSEPAAHEEGRAPFNLAFSRLYSFKGLRDRWTKLPPQSRRSSTNSSVKEHKGTS